MRNRAQMFRLLKKRKTPKPSENIYNAPPEGAYVIGDIHGCYDKMVELLLLIEADILNQTQSETASLPDGLLRPKIVFLGDLIDRGPKSREVIEFLMDYDPSFADIVHLMGNHEEVYLKVLEGDIESLKFWYKFGGREAMRSYKVENLGEIGTNAENLLYRFKSAVPKSHIDFISSFKDYIQLGDYLCVHAGIRPKIELSEQSSRDMHWIRDHFLKYEKPHQHKIIHGHTVVEGPENLTNRIAIDTGAYKGSPLTAVFIRGLEVRFIQTVSDNSVGNDMKGVLTS